MTMKNGNKGLLKQFLIFYPYYPKVIFPED